MVFFWAAAWAASALVAAPETPRPQVATEVQLAVWEDDAPVERIQSIDVSQGELLGVSPVAPGLWTVAWVPARAGEATFTVAGARAQVVVAPPLPTGLEGPTSRSGLVGQAVELRYAAETLPPIEDVQVAAPEGQVLGIEQDGDELVVTWRSDGDLRPRIVPVGVRDARVPGAPPEWTVVRLGVTVPVTISTEPGARLVMEVGDRSYGPVVADDGGSVSVRVELRAGETTGTAVLTDALGNTQRSTVSLAPAQRPVLAAQVEGSLLRGANPPPIHLLALAANGAAWSGGAPVCESVQGSLSVKAKAPGRWVATVPAGSAELLDLRVDCRLPGDAARTSLVVAVEQGLPARLVLRAWPGELSADFPVAQVQAWLEDSRGDRLPPDGLVLRAENGQIQSTVRDGTMIRADFQGDPRQPDAAVIGEWWLPAGEGQPRSIQLGTRRDGDDIVVAGRLVDRAGRPLVGLPVNLALEGVSVDAETDEQGWVEARFVNPVGPARLVAESQGRRAEHLLAPWLEPSGLTVGSPDLIDRAPLRIRAGSVRKVSLGVDRPVLLTGGGDTAVVTLLLLDASGQPVTDEAVALTASAGFISEPKVQADGTLFAIYQPPPRMRSGTVEVTLKALDGSFPDTSVRIDLMPEPVLRAPSVHGGLVTNFVGLQSPYVGVEIEQALAFLPQHANLRVSAEWYRDARTVELDSTTVDLRMTVTPITLASHRRWSKGLWGTWAGAGVVVAPYRLQSWFDDQPAVDSISVHSPGAVVYAGRGYRLRGGELYAEARYLALSSRAHEYDGGIGGLVGVAGLRIVY